MSNIKTNIPLEPLMRAVEAAIEIGITGTIEAIAKKLAAGLSGKDEPSEDAITSMLTAVWSSCEMVAHKKLLFYEGIFIENIKDKIESLPGGGPKGLKDILDEMEKRRSKELEDDKEDSEEEIKLTSKEGGEA